MAPSRREALIVATVVCSLFGLYGWAVFFSSFSHDGSIGPRYNAPGSDWMVYHAAARAFLEGHLPLIFNGDWFTARLNATYSAWLSAPLPFHPWLYPPTYLLIVLPFGALSFAASYAVFTGVTFVALTVVIWHWSGGGYRRWLQAGALLLSPAASLTVVMGQNAFLTGALLIGGFRLLGRWPLLGGALLGVLTYKPQFWLLVPVALVASRQWRALASALATASLAVLLSLVVFGFDAWFDWIHLVLSPPSDFYERWLDWSRMWGQSVYTCAIVLGASRGMANGAQLLALAIGAGSVYYAFSRPLVRDLRLSVILGATVLAAPHVSGYDTVLLAIAAALLFARRPDMPLSHLALLLALWLVPLFNPPRVVPLGLLTPLLICGFIGYAIAVGRAERKTGGAMSLPEAPAGAGATGSAA